MRTILLAMQAGEVDIIEVSVPFSDPTADGPVNQGTNLVALQNGVDYVTILGQVKEARSKDFTVPVLVMGHYSPILAFGGRESRVRCPRS